MAIEERVLEPQVELVQAICRELDGDTEGRLTLADLGKRVGSSPYHLQRVFKHVMGVTPRQYADARRLERFKARVKAGDPVTSSAFEAGYRSTSRLYERAADHLGMVPTAYRRGGDGAAIHYTIVDSPLGRLLVAATERGICFVTVGDQDETLSEKLRREYPSAELHRDDGELSEWVAAIVAYLEGREPHLALPLDVRATAFQRRVWEELQRIPYGETRSYAEVASRIGQPTAARAVARACATNPAPLVIPCHRVVRTGGGLGGYGLGIHRKRALLEQEREGAEGG